MSMKRFLLAASASLAGLMMLVCTWSSASAAPGQVVYFCNIQWRGYSCTFEHSVNLRSANTLPAFSSDFNTAYVNADVSAE